METTDAQPTHYLNPRPNQQSLASDSRKFLETDPAFLGMAREIGILLARRDIQSGDID